MKYEFIYFFRISLAAIVSNSVMIIARPLIPIKTIQIVPTDGARCLQIYGKNDCTVETVFIIHFTVHWERWKFELTEFRSQEAKEWIWRESRYSTSGRRIRNCFLRASSLLFLGGKIIQIKLERKMNILRSDFSASRRARSFSCYILFSINFPFRY